MTDNIEKIVQEAECVAAADEYFKARTWLMDTNDNRRIFEAGFDRAYALLSKLRAPVADERKNYCPEKRKPGGCQLHNLHCGYPKCNEAPTADTQEVPQDTGNPDADHLIGRLMSSDPDFDDCVAAARLIRSLASAPVAGEAQPGDYVQPVPDHCDRIVWRGRYYALGRTALLARDDAAPQASEAVRDVSNVAGQLWDDAIACDWPAFREKVAAALSAQPGAQKGER